MGVMRVPSPSPLEFWFDFASGYAYLAALEIEALAERCGRTVTWRPFTLGVAFKVTGAQGLSSTPLKREYALRDWQRLARLRASSSICPNAIRRSGCPPYARSIISSVAILSPQPFWPSKLSSVISGIIWIPTIQMRLRAWHRILVSTARQRWPAWLIRTSRRSPGRTANRRLPAAYSAPLGSSSMASHFGAAIGYQWSNGGLPRGRGECQRY